VYLYWILQTKIADFSDYDAFVKFIDPDLSPDIEYNSAAYKKLEKNFSSICYENAFWEEGLERLPGQYSAVVGPSNADEVAFRKKLDDLLLFMKEKKLPTPWLETCLDRLKNGQKPLDPPFHLLSNETNKENLIRGRSTNNFITPNTSMTDDSISHINFVSKTPMIPTTPGTGLRKKPLRHSILAAQSKTSCKRPQKTKKLFDDSDASESSSNEELESPEEASDEATPEDKLTPEDNDCTEMAIGTQKNSSSLEDETSTIQEEVSPILKRKTRESETIILSKKLNNLSVCEGLTPIAQTSNIATPQPTDAKRNKISSTPLSTQKKPLSSLASKLGAEKKIIDSPKGSFIAVNASGHVVRKSIRLSNLSEKSDTSENSDTTIGSKAPAGTVAKFRSQFESQAKSVSKTFNKPSNLKSDGSFFKGSTTKAVSTHKTKKQLEREHHEKMLAVAEEKQRKQKEAFERRKEEQRREQEMKAKAREERILAAKQKREEQAANNLFNKKMPVHKSTAKQNELRLKNKAHLESIQKQMEEQKKLAELKKKQAYKPKKFLPVIEDLDETSEQHDVTHTLPTREESDDEENYDVTMNKEKLPSTDTNYVLDISENDSTDDEDNPKKKVPSWATVGLRDLTRQSAIKVCNIGDHPWFPAVNSDSEPCPLQDIFENFIPQKRLNNSGVWL